MTSYTELWSYAAPNAQLVAESIGMLTEQLRRLNDNLEAGTLNIRTHHPLCVTPKALNATMAQVEAIGIFVNEALANGTLVLPAANEPGTCRVCGCTETRACAGGCSWTDRTRTVCSACADVAAKSAGAR